MADILPILAVAALGWVGGAVVNYFADLLPHARRLSRPLCWNCGQPQPWRGFFFWPRRCPHCGVTRRVRVWVVELAAIGIALWLWPAYPDILQFLWRLILLLYFGLVVVMDLEHRVILHPVSWAGAIFAFAIGLSLHGFWVTLWGGVSGYVIMLILYYLGGVFARWISRRRGQPLDDALGYGDVNLSGVIGLLLGWPGVLAGLTLGVFSAGFFSLIYLLGMLVARRYRAFTAIPFGPFLVLGAVLLLFFL